MPGIEALQKTLGVNFKTLSLLEQALVHSSCVNENPSLFPLHNERLEFLGDAVLGLIIAGELYRAFPDLTEGEMTRLRSALVRRDTLARVARSISLGDFFSMGKGEEASGGRNKTTNLAGALEAVIAAVYLDCGMAAAGHVVTCLFAAEWPKLAGPGMDIDYKSRLQEFTQSKFQQTPVYSLTAEAGPGHAKRFTVEVRLNDEVMGKGSGNSKKLAEMEAARSALERLGGGFTE
jgi:ribonuclease III